MGNRTLHKRLPTPQPALRRWRRGRGRRSFRAYYAWVNEALRHLTHGYQLLGSPLLDLPGVRRLARARFASSAFGDVRALRALLEESMTRAAEVLSRRQIQALQMYAAGHPVRRIASQLGLRSRQHMSYAYRRPAVEAVTREFLRLAGVDDQRK